MFERVQRGPLRAVDQAPQGRWPGYPSKYQRSVPYLGIHRIGAAAWSGSLAITFLLLWVAPSWTADEQVVFSQAANGTRALRPFTVSGHWEVRWEVAGGPFSIWILDKDGNLIEKAAHTEKPGKGSSYYAKPGTYSLKVVGSMSEWSITVVQFP